jgi:hypothetical protein
MRNEQLVAVVDFTDDANEDHWSQASWHAEVAARDAAERAGYAKDQLTVNWPDHWTVTLTAPDGRGFAAILRQQRGGPFFGIAREPTERDLLRWAGEAVPPEPVPAKSQPAAGPNTATAWPRIQEHAGETFTTIRGKQFTYHAWAWNITVDHLNRSVPYGAFSQALEAWPVDGPGQLPAVPQPSYVFAILSDPRIRQTDW